MITYPYSDEYMIFDEDAQRYILTPTYALEKLGLNLDAEVNERNAVASQIAVKGILNRISSKIYNFIHKHCISDMLRDAVIHKTATARKYIMQAMSDQLFYEKLKGDMSISTDKEKRAFAIDENAKAVLERIIPEVGYSLLYTGC